MRAANWHLRAIQQLLLLLLASSPALLWAQPAHLAYVATPVEVVGLFKDRAVLRIPAVANRAGKSEVMVRVGETKQGVTLLAANAHGAKVRYQGDTLQLGLSKGLYRGSAAPKRKRVAVPLNPHGQYRINGSINRAGVSFLVDTGATVVALSSDLADRLGIQYRSGRVGRVNTAQGETASFFVDLPEVSIGDIRIRNVRTAIIDGAYPKDVLLGMSFLRQVNMSEDAGVLMLTQK